MEESHKDTDTKEIVERPVKKQKNTNMEEYMQMLVLIRLVNDEFENKNVFGLIDVEVDDPDNHFNAPGKNLLYKLIQPEIVGMTASVCKAWNTQVKEHRIKVLFDAVKFVHNYILDKALELTYIDTYVPHPEGNPETIPPETYMRIKVHFGLRKMYIIEVVRSKIKPENDRVPIKLNVSSSMLPSPMAPIRNITEELKLSKYRLPLHKLCWMPSDCRNHGEDTELQDFKVWQQTAKATLCSWFEFWQCAFKLENNTSMEESHKDTDTKEIVERPVKKQKYTFHMEQKMQMLVLIRLVNGEFENKNVFGLIDVEVDYPDNHFNAPGKNLLYKLIQPEIVGMAAGVCKAWYKQVEKHRILALLEAVDYAHNYMIEKALELTYIDTYVPYPEGNPETIPPETYMRIEVHFGFRKMYAIEVVRSMIKPGDDGVPVKLNVQSSMPRSPMAPITGDIPQWKSKYRLPLHRLCWVPTKCRERSEDAELQDFKDWQQTANATLCSRLEFWQCVAKCRLSFRLNCPTMKTTTKLF